MMDDSDSFPFYSCEDLKSHLTILLYHGVTESTSIGIENYSGKHIKVEEFYRQMSYIKDNCNILSMDEIVDIKRKNEIWPENAVAVTFDDGFRNNYKCAAPILTKLNIPATFYICSGMIDSNKMFWVDKIEDCINLSKKSSIEIFLDTLNKFSLKSDEEKIALSKQKLL